MRVFAVGYVEGDVRTHIFRSFLSEEDARSFVAEYWNAIDNEDYDNAVYKEVDAAGVPTLEVLPMKVKQ